MSWVPFFVGIVAVAFVVQTAVLIAIYILFRRVSREIEGLVQDLHGRIQPVVTRIQILLEETQPRISGILSDAAEITRTARTQVQRVDRVVAETIERLRFQLVHADQIVTGALETIEQAGTSLRRTVYGPVQSVAALIRGLQSGLEFYRGNRRRRPSDAPGETHDENLFI